MPNQLNAVIMSGVLGVLVALAGFFVDSIYTFITNFRKKRNTSSDRERIKRKVVPGTENRQTRSRRAPSKDSIDIFDDSFDNSPKQTIGSNKRFKQLTADDLKERSINTSKDQSKSKEKSNKRFSRNPFKKSSEDKKEVKNEVKTSKRSSKRRAPRVRPKRK